MVKTLITRLLAGLQAGRGMLLAMMSLIAAGLISQTAAADTRKVYTIAEIPVDERAETTIEAQEKAFAAARIIGARRLMNKITLPVDRGASGGLMIDLETANRLAAAVDIVEEARGGGTYRGKLSVVFNPRAVRSYLDGLGVPYVDRQAPLAVLAVDEGSALAATLPEEDLFAIAPFKLAIVPGGADPDLDYRGIQSELDARRVIIARQPTDLSPTEILLWTPDNIVQLGQLSRQLMPADQARSLRDRLDSNWKKQSVVRSATRTQVRSTIRYTSIAEWVGLRRALSRSPLISQFNVQALASDGAVVDFAFAGDIDRLRNDLMQRGIAIDENPTGWVMRTAGYRPAVPQAPSRPADTPGSDGSRLEVPTEDSGEDFLDFLTEETVTER
jgi:hypothetical protein